MRQIFQNYYPPPEDFFDQLWEEAIIAMDANVLLHMYRYSEDVRNNLFAVLKSLSSRLWLPHQVALEFSRRRPGVILEQINIYEHAIKMIDDLKESVRSKIEESLNFRFHPNLDKNILQEEIESPLDKLRTDIEQISKRHPNLLQEDPILNDLLNLFNGCVGPDYDNQRKQDIYKQGKDRYDRKIPPGYKDAEGRNKKEGNDIYGDLIIWFQMIDHVRENKKPILFITDDSKDDWWWRVKGKTLGCQPLLREEMEKETGCIFYIYKPEKFLEHAQNRLNIEVQEETIVEVRSVQAEEEIRQTVRQEQLIDLERQKIIESLRDSPLTSLLGRYDLSEVPNLHTALSSRYDRSEIEKLIKDQAELNKLMEEEHKLIEEERRRFREEFKT